MHLSNINIIHSNTEIFESPMRIHSETSVGFSSLFPIFNHHKNQNDFRTKPPRRVCKAFINTSQI